MREILFRGQTRRSCFDDDCTACIKHWLESEAEE